MDLATKAPCTISAIRQRSSSIRFSTRSTSQRRATRLKRPGRSAAAVATAGNRPGTASIAAARPLDWSARGCRPTSIDAVARYGCRATQRPIVGAASQTKPCIERAPRTQAALPATECRAFYPNADYVRACGRPTHGAAACLVPDIKNPGARGDRHASPRQAASSHSTSRTRAWQDHSRARTKSSLAVQTSSSAAVSLHATRGGYADLDSISGSCRASRHKYESMTAHFPCAEATVGALPLVSRGSAGRRLGADRRRERLKPSAD
jgi:hypothetical protein